MQETSVKQQSQPISICRSTLHGNRVFFECQYFFKFAIYYAND